MRDFLLVFFFLLSILFAYEADKIYDENMHLKFSCEVWSKTR